jgi:hypothetical protein
LEQNRVPTHRLYVISFSPSGECVVAATGQTYSHGAFSQCWQSIGCAIRAGGAAFSSRYWSMRSQCISRWARTPSRPTEGTLFSAWQAMTHALQPVQRDRSIVIAHWFVDASRWGAGWFR